MSESSISDSQSGAPRTAVGDIRDITMRRASQYLLLRRYAKVELKHYNAPMVPSVPHGAHVFALTNTIERNRAPEIVAVDPMSMTVVYHGLAPA